MTEGSGLGARKLLYLIEDDVDIRNLVRTVLEGYGYEVQADIFRFFDSTYIELEAGHVRNEP